MQKAYTTVLHRLLMEGITAEVHEWVNSIILVSKPDGTARLHLDPKDLNKAIERNEWYSRAMDDILPEPHT